MARVAVLGGGFGGLAGAHELRRLLGDGDEVVVVDRRDRFAMGFAKLWDLVGLRPIEEGTGWLRHLAAHGIEHLQAEIRSVDPGERVVDTDGGELRADGLLIALGADDAQLPISGEPGAAVHNLYDAAALPAMRAALERFERGRLLIAVAGQPFKCPPAPFEAALLLDEHLRSRGVREAVELAIATPAPSALPVAGPEASGAIADALAARGIELLTGRALGAVDAAGQQARFDSGEERGFDLLLAVPATAPPQVLGGSPLAGTGGWITPDPRSLRSDFAHVYAVGDCTTVPTATAALPKAGIFAEGEALVAARNLAADLVGGASEVFDGHGFCFLELPGQQVALVEGDFFAEPAPDVGMRAPNHEGFLAKQRFERERLQRWLG